MTLAPPRPAELVVEPELEAKLSPLPAGSARRAVRQALVAVAVVTLALAGMVALFEVPIASVWFKARQRQLAAEFKIPRRTPPMGGAAAILQIPELDVNLVVVEGDSADELRAGPGHRPETPLPGKLGNSVIVGHRAGWGAPFGDLHTLERGDFIVTQARGGSDKVVYEVRQVTLVHPDAVELLAKSNDYRLTLVTATGGNVSSDHLVVVAISGERGKLSPPRGTRVAISKPSSFFNQTFILALLALALGAIAFVQLRRRHRFGATLVVVVPLAIAGTFGVLLSVDLLLSPLR